MDIEKFITYLAWGLGVLATLSFIFCSWWSIEEYSEGNIEGSKKFPIFRSLIVAIICWSWILSR